MTRRADAQRDASPPHREGGGVRALPPHHRADPLTALQRSAGNRAVTAAIGGHRGPSSAPTGSGTVTLTLPGRIHPVATAMDAADVRARVPTFADLKAAYTDKKLRIPQSVVKDRVTQLLNRMAFEKRLRSKDPVPTIVAKIFPGPGVIDERAFTNALDVADRTVVYRSVLDADTAVKKADKARLKVSMKDAADLIAKVEGDAAGLTAVFGTQAAVAKARYAAARSALGTVAGDLDKHVTTDYNLDDPEVFLGGWANHSAQLMHLLAGVVQNVDPAGTQAVLVHEAAHLGDASVDDLGYYGTAAFEAMSETDKVNNAAHYEELPRRVLGTSRFPGHVFTPGTTKGGAAITRVDIVRKIAGDHLQHAWDAAVDAHGWLRRVRKAWLRGNGAPFAAHRALILELSRVCDLTVHAQAPAHARVTALDVTLMESVARGMGLVGRLVSSRPLPAGPWTDQGAAQVMVAEAAQQYGQLLRDPARDKVLIDWFAGHFRALPSAP